MDNLWAPRPRTAPPPSRWGQFVGLVAGLVATAALATGCWYGFVAGNTRPNGPSPGIGLLKQIGSYSPTTFGDTAVHDACSVIRIQHLNEIGVPLAENEPVVQQRVDGNVLPEAALPQSAGDAVGHCSYPLANGNAMTVSVHQTPFNTAADLESLQQEGIRAGATLRTADGLSLAQWHDALSNSRRVNVWKPDLLIDVSIGTSKPWPINGMDATATAIQLETLVKNAIIAGPIAHEDHYYDYPLSRLRNPCEVANFAAFGRAFPSHAGAPSIIRGTYHPTRSQSSILMSCKRTNVVFNGSLNKAEHHELLVEFAVADNEQDARTENARLCDRSAHPEVVDATPSVGPSRSCLVKHGTDWALWFQLDQVNLRVSTPGLGGTAEEVGDRVAPAALAMAEFGVNR